jgi:cell division transport system permease protein
MKKLSLNKMLSNRRGNAKHNPLMLLLLRHTEASLLSLGQLSRTPFATLMITLIIAIALALPTSFYVLLQNAKLISNDWQHDTQITVYLKPGIDQSTLASLIESLKTRPDISGLTHILPEQALADLEKKTGINNLTRGLTENPLPDVLILTPTQTNDETAVKNLLATIQEIPGVDSAQLDMQWLERLHALMSTAQTLNRALTLFLAFGILLIISHTIYLAIQQHSQDIEVYRLIGATNAFIQRPFLYAGILYGLGGAIFAWLIVLLLTVWIKIPINHLLVTYGSQYRMHFLSFGDTLLLFAMGLMIGLIGAWMAVTKELLKAG